MQGFFEKNLIYQARQMPAERIFVYYKGYGASV